MEPTGNGLSKTQAVIDRQFGRQAFGADPALYHSARPPYPQWVFELLKTHCKQHPPTFEIGAGTGLATRPLLDLGASPLVAIEPDPRLAAFLKEHNPDPALKILTTPFETANLEENSFDLGICATAFHWLDETQALTKVARLLRPGGWWAMFWNDFGDPNRADPFHEATKALLNYSPSGPGNPSSPSGPGNPSSPASPSRGTGNLPFSLDTTARVQSLQATNAFDTIEHHSAPWTLTLNPSQVVNLYSTYSNINIRPDKSTILTQLEHIARTGFNGLVTRNMVTSLYIARRK
ncbi:MAG TPA: class I SAM-dependent methyltransferase [Puia sp.]